MDINIEDRDFKHYLLNEFFWELAQHVPIPSDFVDCQADSIEVLSYNRNDDLRIRLANKVYEIRLSWRGDVPATIKRIDGE